MTEISSTRGPLSPVDRRALTAVAVQFFVNGAMTASIFARLPEIRDRIDVTLGELGLLLTAVGVFGFVGSVIAGRVIERWSTRSVLVAGGIVMVLALPVIGLATSPLVFLAAMLTYSLVDVLVDISMNLQGSWLSGRKSVPVMNRLHGLWSLGSVAGGLAAAWAASVSLSLAVHLGVVAAIMAVLVIVVARGLLPNDEDHIEVGDSSTDPIAPHPTGVRRRTFVPMMLIALGGAFALLLEQTSSDWAAFRLTDDLGTAAGFASLGFVAFTVGMTTARLGGDWLRVRLGRVGLHRVALAFTIIGLVVASTIDDRWVVLGGYLVAGLGVATFFPELYDDAARLPGRRGAGLGVMTAGSRVAGLIGPTIVGVLAGSSLSVGTAVLIVTMPCAVGFGVVAALARRRVAAAGSVAAVTSA